MSASSRKPGSLGRSGRLALYIIGIGVWLTGGLWLVFHYFLLRKGEFGPTPNPLEPWWLKLHGAFAFATIWIFGLLWGVHITKGWPHKRGRWSGSVLTGVFAFLIVSGYLLYYVGDDGIRPVLSVLHWGMGLAGPIFFGVHRLRRRGHRSRHTVLSARPASLAQAAGAESLVDRDVPVVEPYAGDYNEAP